VQGCPEERPQVLQGREDQGNRKPAKLKAWPGLSGQKGCPQGLPYPRPSPFVPVSHCRVLVSPFLRLSLQALEDGSLFPFLSWKPFWASPSRPQEARGKEAEWMGLAFPSSKEALYSV
jgi:hypothetical protein